MDHGMADRFRFVASGVLSGRGSQICCYVRLKSDFVSPVVKEDSQRISETCRHVPPFHLCFSTFQLSALFLASCVIGCHSALASRQRQGPLLASRSSRSTEEIHSVRLDVVGGRCRFVLRKKILLIDCGWCWFGVRKKYYWLTACQLFSSMLLLSA